MECHQIFCAIFECPETNEGWNTLHWSTVSQMTFTQSPSFWPTIPRLWLIYLYYVCPDNAGLKDKRLKSKSGKKAKGKGDKKDKNSIEIFAIVTVQVCSRTWPRPCPVARVGQMVQMLKLPAWTASIRSHSKVSPLWLHFRSGIELPVIRWFVQKGIYRK